MKTEKQILKRWNEQGNKWDNLSQKHTNSKDSKIKGHVTNQEHITGEKLCFIEGWINALEWVINNEELLNANSGGMIINKAKMLENVDRTLKKSKFLNKEIKKKVKEIQEESNRNMDKLLEIKL